VLSKYDKNLLSEMWRLVCDEGRPSLDRFYAACWLAKLDPHNPKLYVTVEKILNEWDLKTKIVDRFLNYNFESSAPAFTRVSSDRRVQDESKMSRWAA
jgi:hypothetical protein